MQRSPVRRVHNAILVLVELALLQMPAVLASDLAGLPMSQLALRVLRSTAGISSGVHHMVAEVLHVKNVRLHFWRVDTCRARRRLVHAAVWALIWSATSACKLTRVLRGLANSVCRLRIVRECACGLCVRAARPGGPVRECASALLPVRVCAIRHDSFALRGVGKVCSVNSIARRFVSF